MMSAEYFKAFRQHVIGIDTIIETPYGHFPMIYADWTASGRLYGPIEDFMRNDISPLVGNTHTESSYTGSMMTKAYGEAKRIIKSHVNAQENDVIIFAGSGMTGAINKLQRIMGLRFPERIQEYVESSKGSSRFQSKTKKQGDNHNHIAIKNVNQKPIVFVTHMEHHSNHTSWLETIAEVKIIPTSPDGGIDLAVFRCLIQLYKNRPLKIASITACSNVTGIETPYHEIAKLMHQVGGYCFVDFACSGPYKKIDMHPSTNMGEHLDAIFLSPHKFLGGPGTSGIVIFNATLLYNNKVPDNPGGGTVVFTDPWNACEYITNIEVREDGGTPPFLQAIRTGMAVRLKEQMGIDNIHTREVYLVGLLMHGLNQIEGVHVLANNQCHRLAVVSFCAELVHFNLVVRLLNDRFGIQARGGCACAGTYGHYLLRINKAKSEYLRQAIFNGELNKKLGWTRLSLHPVMLEEEVEYIIDAVKQIVTQHDVWSLDYRHNKNTNEFDHISHPSNKIQDEIVEGWFEREYTTNVHASSNASNLVKKSGQFSEAILLHEF